MTGVDSGAAMIAATISLRASSPSSLQTARSQVRAEWTCIAAPYAALPLPLLALGLVA